MSWEWNPRKKKKSEQAQEYLDRQKITYQAQTVSNQPGAQISRGATYTLTTPSMIQAPQPNRAQGAAQQPAQQEQIYTLTLDEPTTVAPPPKQPDQSGQGSTLTILGPEEQAQELERQRKLLHETAFAEQKAKLDAEFWRIANNPGSMLGANESPYYGLYMKQYQERARDREVNAYTRAADATGGYGSSYATMAGDQAYRETMQEFDELAPTLMKSKSQRMAEILQERGMMDEYNQYYNQQDGASASGMTQGALDAYNYILSLGESGWNGSNEETVRAMLNAQATAGGWTSEDVETAIGALKAGSSAQISDAVKQFEANPTLSGAAQIMANAKANGTWEQVQTQVSTAMVDAYTKALDDPASGYNVAGIDAEAWSEMSEEEKAGAILQAGGEAVKNGMMSETDYAKILTKDAETAIKEIENSDDRPIVKSRAVFDAISGILVCVENGTITQETADEIIKSMANSSAVKEAYDKHAKWLKSFANDKEAKEKLGLEAMPDGFWRLDDAQEEALRELDRIYKKK